MMYKAPYKFIARVRPVEGNKPGIDDSDAFERLADALDAIESYGMDEYEVGSLLTVWFGGSYWVTTYYVMTDKREAAFDAARNGFPFYADDNDRPIKVGLLARIYRAIIA